VLEQSHPPAVLEQVRLQLGASAQQQLMEDTERVAVFGVSGASASAASHVSSSSVQHAVSGASDSRVQHAISGASDGSVQRDVSGATASSVQHAFPSPEAVSLVANVLDHATQSPSPADEESAEQLLVHQINVTAEGVQVVRNYVREHRRQYSWKGIRNVDGECKA
jgi:hypothetical protein